MERDQDLIARIYVHRDQDGTVLDGIRTSSLYVPPQLQRPSNRPQGQGDRESTEPPEERNPQPLVYEPCLEIRFSNLPRTPHGIVFGRDARSDVVLPNTAGISQHHFSVTFDEAHRPIIKDWGSLVGTEVTYGNKGHGYRRAFQWIVGGNHFLQPSTEIIVNVHSDVAFRIIVEQHDVTSQAYINNVARFRQGTSSAEDLFSDMNWNSIETRRPTGTHTPGTGPIHLTKRLGEGGFGVVTYFWNVSNGNEYALKKPLEKHIDGRRYEGDRWEREARILGRISHPNVVKLLKAVFTPYPQLFLEYMPKGALEDHQDITLDENLSIVQQCLSALAYLHSQTPPIVHRDIKPGNILVQHRLPGSIHVKFGDFGLSRAGEELLTICGTSKYLAPEIFLARQTQRMAYTPVVDIWSLGLVAYKLMCKLPTYRDMYNYQGLAWCNTVRKKFDADRALSSNPLKEFVLDSMLIISPDSRLSANDCYEKAKKLQLEADSASYDNPSLSTDSEEQSTIREVNKRCPITNQEGTTEEEEEEEEEDRVTTARLLTPRVHAGTAVSDASIPVEPVTVPSESSPSVARRKRSPLLRPSSPSITRHSKRQSLSVPGDLSLPNNLFEEPPAPDGKSVYERFVDYADEHPSLGYGSEISGWLDGNEPGSSTTNQLSHAQDRVPRSQQRNSPQHDRQVPEKNSRGSEATLPSANLFNTTSRNGTVENDKMAELLQQLR